MQVSAVPGIDAGAAQGYAQAYGPSAQNFASKNGLIFNPFTQGFEADPRLAYEYAQDAHYQQTVAQARNAATNATLTTPAEQLMYRNGTNATPGPGATYGSLAQGGYQAVSPDQALGAQQTGGVRSQIQQLQTLASRLNGAGSNKLSGMLKQYIGGTLGLDPDVQLYDKLKSQLPASMQAAIPEIGTSQQATMSAYSALLHNLTAQQYVQSPTQTQVPTSYAQPTPVGSYSLGAIGNSPQPAVQDAYGATEPPNLTPGAMGANAYQSQFGGQ